MSALSKIFKKNKNIVIGAVHLPPLLGYPNSPEIEIAVSNALRDAASFEKGGADAIIFENNYDLPHKIFVDAPTISAMTIVGEKMLAHTKLPVGISVLWNDYKTALSIAKLLNLQFIRIPVFVDKVETSYGIIDGVYKEAVRYRKMLKADDVAIFTDIHVKHAILLSKHNHATSAKLAMKHGSDGIIITGKWTGDAPDMYELQSLRKTVGNFPILIGSGLDFKNARDLFKFANGAIVSTSLKTGVNIGGVNIKPYEARIDVKKVRVLIKALG